MKRALITAALAAALFSFAGCKEKEDPWVDPDVVTLSVETTATSTYADEKELVFGIRCNGKWTCYASEDWVTVSTASGKGSDDWQEVHCTIAENQSGAERYAVISVAAKDNLANITVTQRPDSEHSISNFFSDCYDEHFSKVRICAHRANTYKGTYIDRDSPENSIEAIRKCIELGMDMIELDVRETKDGYLVCCHDPFINYVTNGSGNIADMTYAQIVKYDMKIRENGVVVKGVHIPLLETALRTAKDKIWVNLDLAKTTISAEKVISVIRNAGMLDQTTCYTGSDADLAAEYYKLDHRISCHLSISKASQTASIATMETTPLFQINHAYYDGEKGTTELSAAIRQYGFCSFSNLLDHDSQVLLGKTGALEMFTNARIDFLQTDIGDHDNVQNFLKSKNLR